ncbi:23S rRNA (guanosine(2251)-2'-O)-methyltransferase RlmB [Halothermothrix orenii]|uniref:RNA methyltransferase n=1 Tax=Halothermothrix orenii (strain H 168 / OCM 544 / DSM 9562) TaxID=373903 RepID=B8D0A6_HALOH|nr:23S rRNA (guanosine(2251)-2'-O)-methyltransferase RlmB [Halothermothrix orenii]ACL68860.1 RNA methyltransferase [Halothermothrix orenii H 168]
MAQIEGRNPVIEAIKSGRTIKKIFIQEGVRGKKVDRIIKEASRFNIPLQKAKKDFLDKKARSHSHQGIIAMADDIKYVSPREMVEIAREKGEDPFIIILDQVQDPHNLGAIIRTAYAAGAHGLIYPRKRSADITPVVTKASAGAVNHLPLAKVSNINYTIADLKDMGLWITGTDVRGTRPYYSADYKGPVGLVIGNEGKGMRRLVKENCDFVVNIPMSGELGSLNASVAAGVVIFEVVRQRRST